MNLGPQMADISVYNQKADFKTGPPVKIKISKSSFLHARENQKVGI